MVIRNIKASYINAVFIIVALIMNLQSTQLAYMYLISATCFDLAVGND